MVLSQVDREVPPADPLVLALTAGEGLVRVSGLLVSPEVHLPLVRLPTVTAMPGL